MSLTCKGKKKKKDDLWESYKQSSANGSFLEKLHLGEAVSWVVKSM